MFSLGFLLEFDVGFKWKNTSILHLCVLLREGRFGWIRWIFGMHEILQIYARENIPCVVLRAFACHFAGRTRTWGSNEFWSTGHQANIWEVWLPSCRAAPWAIGCLCASGSAFAICLLQIQPNLPGANAIFCFCLQCLAQWDTIPGCISNLNNIWKEA